MHGVRARVRTRAAAGAAVALAALTQAAIAGPAPAAGAPAPAPLSVVASWELNEAAGATVVRDSSGNRIDGTVNSHVAGGSPVIETGASLPSTPGKGYRWPAPPKGEGGQPDRNDNRLLLFPDDRRLDPQGRDFAVEVRLRTGATMPNIVQKGQSGPGATLFKMEIHEGVPTCVFRGKVRNADGSTRIKSHAVGWGSSIIVSGTPQWRVLRCERRTYTTRKGLREDVALYVDGVRKKSTTLPSGVIDSPYRMVVGGKISCSPPSPPGVGCDYFSGWMDYVRVEAAPLP